MCSHVQCGKKKMCNEVEGWKTQTPSIGFTAKEILVYLQEHCNET